VVARIRAFPNALYRKYGVDVTKTVLTVTVYSPFDFLKFFKTKVVIAESSPLAASMVAEDYPGALASGEFHCGLLPPYNAP
jgi:hypothetical protein